MNMTCHRCGGKEFKILESIWEDIDLSRDKGEIAKGVACCNCGCSFIAKVNIEIKNIDLVKM